MFHTSRRFRWLLMIVLAFSTSAASLVPPFAESALVGTRPLPQESSGKPCCCATQSGSCCGMGCCTAKDAPPPAPAPAPIHQDGSRSDVSPLGLLFCLVCLRADSSGRRAWDRGGDVIGRSLAEATLQSIQVRLDA